MINENTKLLTIIPRFRYWLIGSLAVLASTVLVSWLVSFFAYYQVLEEMLRSITQKAVENRFGFELNLLSWSISYLLILIVSVLFLSFTVFLKHKTHKTGIISVGFLVAILVLLTGMLLFGFSLIPDFSSLQAEYGLQKMLLLYLPVGLILLLLTITFALNIILTHHILSDIIANQKWKFLHKTNDMTNPDEMLVEHEKQNETNIIMPNLATNVAGNQQSVSNDSIPTTINQATRETNPNDKFHTVDYTHTLNDVSAEKVSAKATDTSAPNATDFLVVKENQPSTLEEIVWTPTQINEVWSKGQIIPNVNPKLYRKDYAGAWMFFDSFTQKLPSHENYKSYDWTIVHHRPRTHGGETEIDNLEPMNVHNAVFKAENYPRWETKVSSVGNENKVKVQTWKARNTE